MKKKLLILFLILTLSFTLINNTAFATPKASKNETVEETEEDTRYNAMENQIRVMREARRNMNIWLWYTKGLFEGKPNWIYLKTSGQLIQIPRFTIE
jgi:hypothetical protein